jgi:hypothetical protein
LRLFFNCDVIVTFAQVKLAEEDRSNCVFEYCGDSGQGTNIFDHDRIDLPVVEKGLEHSIFLLVIEDGGTVG